MTEKPKCELDDEMATARRNPFQRTALTLIELLVVIIFKQRGMFFIVKTVGEKNIMDRF